MERTKAAEKTRRNRERKLANYFCYQLLSFSVSSQLSEVSEPAPSWLQGRKFESPDRPGHQNRSNNDLLILSASGTKGRSRLERAAEKDMKVDCGMSLMMCSIKFN